MNADPTGEKKKRPPLLQQLQAVEWPVSDRALWSEAIKSASDPLDDDGPAAGLAEVTKRKRAAIWGQYLSFLRDQGWLDPNEQTATRLTPARAIHFIQHMHSGRSDSTIRQTVLELSLVASALCPERDWKWLRKLPGVPSRGDALRARRAAHSPDPVKLVGAVARELRRLQGTTLDLDGLLWARDLTIMMVASHAFLRPRNLHDARLGQTVIVGEHEIWLNFRAGETKRQRPIHTSLHEVPASALRFYLREVRPHLLGDKPAVPHLWLSQHGTALGPSALAESCTRVGAIIIGQRTNPNSTRHAFATHSRERNPTDLKSVATGLTHSTTRTMLTYYDRSGDRPAEREWRKLKKKVSRGF
jgi:integrase/recombinase XerD